MGIFLYKTFPESEIIARDQTTIDNTSQEPTKASSKGEQLFKQNCAACHAINKDVTGPALAGVLNRGPWEQDNKSIYAWVHDPAGFMAKNAYTQELKAKYGVIMTPFPQLKNEEIDAILNYVKDAAVVVPEVVVN